MKLFLVIYGVSSGIIVGAGVVAVLILIGLVPRTRDAKRYLPYFQIPYSIGIGVGVALFFNKFIPTYTKYEPSPMELKMISLNKEIENQLRGKD